MSSVAKNLLNNESVVFEARKHWVALLRDSAPAIGLVLVALVVSVLLPSTDGFVGFVFGLVGIARWLALVVGIAWIAYNVAVWRAAEFAVTSLRVLRYEGLFQRRSSETLLSAVSDVKLNVGFLGNALGYGDLRIFTQSGEAGVDDLNMVAGATGFRNAMMNVKIAEKAGARHAAQAQAPFAPETFVPASGSVPGASVARGPAPAPGPLPAPGPAPATVAPVALATAEEYAARLVKLAELRDRGVISPAEFEAKKTEILARM